LEIPDYRRYYAGQGVSLIGIWLQTAAVKWLVFDKTRDTSMLGIVETAGLMPGLLVGLFAGVLADRVSPRRLILVMQICQMSLAFLLATLVGLHIEQIWEMALILALARVCVTFEMPSRQVFLYWIVGRSSLMNAIALNSGLFHASRVLGSALAGVFLSWFGGAACFALNGTAYLAAIGTLLSIRQNQERSTGGRGGLREVLGGFAYLRCDRRVATVYLLMTLFGIVGMGYDAMIPAYARVVIGTDVRGYGVLLACSGIGATCGALTMASLGSVRRREELMLVGLTLFACFLAALAVMPGLVRHAWPDAFALRMMIGAVCLLGVSFGAITFYSSAQTIIQIAVPDHLRGRIMGIWMIIYSGSVPLGALWTGYAAEAQGVSPVLGLSAGLCVLVAIGGVAGGLLEHVPSHREPQETAAFSEWERGQT
jgi:MFS family permease